MTKFAFEFDDVRTSNVFSRFEIRRIFSRPIVEFESQVYTIGAACLHPRATGTSEMLKVIAFVGCVNKSKFLNLGFSQHNFHYGKNVSIIGITFLHFI